MEKVAEFKPLFSGNEAAEGHEAKNKALSKRCLGTQTSALQVPTSPSLAPGPSQGHEGPAIEKQSCPFPTPTSTKRNALQIALFAQ